MLDAQAERQFGDGPYTEPTPETIADLLSDWEWRICSGYLYKIKAKHPDAPDEDPDALPSLTIPFKPNQSQLSLLRKLWNRNIVLKARQLGFSTLIEILALDYALFNDDVNVVVLAQDLDAASNLFNDKIAFAYDRLPELLRDKYPTIKRTQSQMTFGHNNSTIRVVTSARSGTVHFLHVSEMGKIAANYPEKAREITTGTLQALVPNGTGFIESTAEGQDGAFYELARRAEGKKDQRAKLTPADWRFHFFPWWVDDEYRLDPSRVVITSNDHVYFDTVEGKTGTVLDLEQRAWYVAKRENDFAHEPDLMWREYPSTSEECWQASNEGKYLARVVAQARKDGRIGAYPMIPHIPANTFWDIGATDATPIWVHQPIHGMDRFVNFRETSLESYLDDVLWLESLGCVFDTHYLPHDSEQNEKGVTRITSAVSKLREIRPDWNWVVVPRTREKIHSINNLRLAFANYQFNEATTKEGLRHLENYSRDWNTRLQTWMNQPRHDEHSHAADAIMQHSDGYQPASRASRRDDDRKPRRANAITA